MTTRHHRWVSLSWEFNSVAEDELSLRGVDEADEHRADVRLLWPPHKAVREGSDAAFLLRTYSDKWLHQEHQQVPLWVTTGQLHRNESQWHVVQLAIEAEPIHSESAGLATVTSRVLRELRLGLVHEALAALATKLPDDPRFLFEEVLDLAGPATARKIGSIPEPTPEAKAGRPRRSDGALRRFAEVALRTGGSYKAISREFDLPTETVRTWLKACRAEGWLAPGQPGRRGAPAPGKKMLEYMRGVS